MLNKSTSRSKYVIQSGVTQYPIGFAFQHNGDGTPQIRVTIGDMVAEENVHFVISKDLLNIELISLGENDKWVGSALVIERDIPFVQESDYQVGRISSEQIEKDFDLSVMRDQMLADKISEHTDDVQGEINALHSRIDLVQEEHASDMATVNAEVATKATKAELEIVKNTLNSHTNELTTLSENMANKATKVELENAKTILSQDIQSNASAIQTTRNDMNAKDGQLESKLNEHTGAITALQNKQTTTDNKVQAIESKIPESASATNQLATKADLETIDLADYVKKSGDTMTGDLVFDVVSSGYTVTFQDSYKNVDTGNTDSVIKRISSYHQTQGLIFSETKNGTVDMQFTMIADGFFMPTGNRLLGSSVYPWANVYAKKLNNGADLIVPTEGGTLARIEDLSGYLPLSGGTLTGPLYVDGHSLSATIDNTFQIQTKGQRYRYYFGSQLWAESLVAGGETALGVPNAPWGVGYVKKLNNGADLTVPTEGGTLARVEDINAAVGDISTALTAILGE